MDRKLRSLISIGKDFLERNYYKLVYKSVLDFGQFFVFSSRFMDFKEGGSRSFSSDMCAPILNSLGKILRDKEFIYHLITSYESFFANLSGDQEVSQLA